MNQAQFFEDFEALPPNAQQELIDFAAFLRQRYGQSKKSAETEYLLKSPANAAHLEQSIAEYKAGKVFVRDIIDE